MKEDVRMKKKASRFDDVDEEKRLDGQDEKAEGIVAARVRSKVVRLFQREGIIRRVRKTAAWPAEQRVCSASGGSSPSGKQTSQKGLGWSLFWRKKGERETDLVE
jgi:hypothetical protein